MENSIAISASEAVERSMKSAHDKHNILRSLQNVESDLQSCKYELQRSLDELSHEKQRYKGAYIEKLAAERKAAELVASKSKVEVS